MRLLGGDDVGLNPVNNEGLTPLAGLCGMGRSGRRRRCWDIRALA